MSGRPSILTVRGEGDHVEHGRGGSPPPQRRSGLTTPPVSLCRPASLCRTATTASREVFLYVLAFLLFATPLVAQDTMPPAPYAYRQLGDPAKEARAQALMETLRCLQCQGQSIADSDAPIAGAMRSLVRERIAAGEAPEAIRTWLIERYGDYVSYQPRFGSVTWPLYAAPLLLLAVAGLLLRRRFKGRVS